MNTTTDHGQRRPAFLGIADVAHITGLSERTVRRYVAQGTIPARKAGARVLVREMDLDAWWRTLEPCGGASEPLTVAVSTQTTGGRW